jgi:hypothetical protein
MRVGWWLFVGVTLTCAVEESKETFTREKLPKGNTLFRVGTLTI